MPSLCSDDRRALHDLPSIFATVTDRRYSREMIIRARTVVTMAREPIENGAVAIDGATITGVGTFREIAAEHTGEILDLGEQALLPGLINAHCHLDYTMLRGQIPPQPSFTDWIRQINACKAAFSEKDYRASIAEGFAEAKRFGTTSIINLEALPRLIGEFKCSPIRAWWCPEMIDVRERTAAAEILDVERRGLRLRQDPAGGFGLAPHALYTASSSLYRQCSDLALRDNLLLTTHLAESHEEMEMFRDGCGPLFDFMKAIGRPMEDCGRTTPLALLLSREKLDQRWIIAHLNELTENDFDLLADERFHIAHCPRSHRHFGHAAFALDRLRSLGFNICLGTDSLASNSSLSLFDEMRELQKVAPSLSPRDLLEMVTTNPASALGQAKSLGRVRAGYLADLISLPLSVSGGDPLEQVVAFDEPVAWMMIDGKRV
ncbi:MAG: amidohydrolase family protein [Verrucomicrobiota bacterium]